MATTQSDREHMIDTIDDTADKPYRFIDLFCGIGGIRIAFERSGCECVFSNDIDKFACKTYEVNFDEHPSGDITQLAPSDIPDFDILCGGFPCQPFSLAGKKAGFEDTRGTLFFDVARIIKDRRPKAFMLENVKNLMSHDHGRTFQTIAATLDELGYDIAYRVIDGSIYVPQHRERTFIVGFDRGRYAHHDYTLELSNPDEQGQQHVHVVRHDDGDARPSVIRTKDGDVVLNRMPPLTPDEHIHKLSDILDANDTVPDKYTLSDATFSYLRQHKAKHQARGNGFGYTVADVDGISRTLSARYGKDGSEILIPQSGKNPRKLAPRECARLQGFPDTFDIPVSDTQAYHQFGNSVVVPLVTDIAKSMVSELKQLDIEWSKQMMTNVLLQP